MEKKYVMTDETTILKDGTILHKIQAIKDFGDVKKGDLGGWIEKEENLSHGGDCWVYDDAYIVGSAFVYDNAKIHGRVRIIGHAKIFDNARVYGDVTVGGGALIFDDAQVSENALIYDEAWVSGDSLICGNAKIFGNANITNNARIYGCAQIYDNAEVCDNAMVYDNAQIHNDGRVYDNAKVFNDADVCGRACVSGNAMVQNMAHIFTETDCIIIGPIGSKFAHITFYKTAEHDIMVSCEHYTNTIDAFISMIESVCGKNGKNPNSSYYDQYIGAVNYVKRVMVK